MSEVIRGTVSETKTLTGRASALLARDGDSAYVVACQNGFEGTEAEWLESLKGERGEKGVDGTTPHIGKNGNWWIGETDTGVPANGVSAAAPIITSINLPSSAWEGTDGLYSQVVAIDGITAYSKVDLLPSVEQLAIFHNKDVAFITENEDGVVTVFAIGDKPLLDYTIQAQITEVLV